MAELKENIQIKPNNRVLLSLFIRGKYEYKYLGRINLAKKIFYTFRPLNKSSVNKQKISLPFSLVKKLSDEGFYILIQIPGRNYNLFASEFLLSAMLDNKLSDNREIRMTLPLSEFNTGSFYSSLTNKKTKSNYSDKLKIANAVWNQNAQSQEKMTSG